MVTGGELYGICDGVIASSVAPLPKNFDSFITLGDYRISDVRVGELKRKFREVEIAIDCGAVVKAGKKEAEANAEEAAYNLAIKVRTILMANKTLVCDSFPDGLAKISEPVDEGLQYVIYDTSSVALNTITYLAKIVESA